MNEDDMILFRHQDLLNAMNEHLHHCQPLIQPFAPVSILAVSTQQPRRGYLKCFKEREVNQHAVKVGSVNESIAKVRCGF